MRNLKGWKENTPGSLQKRSWTASCGGIPSKRLPPPPPRSPLPRWPGRMWKTRGAFFSGRQELCRAARRCNQVALRAGRRRSGDVWEVRQAC